MKIILLSEDSVRLVADDGPLVIESPDPEQQYSPFHMLGGALAYCTFSVMYSWAEHTQHAVDDLVIDVRWVISTDAPRRVSEMHLTYHWPSLPEQKREAAKRVAHLCTIHETLLHPAIVTTEPMHERPATTTPTHRVA